MQHEPVADKIIGRLPQNKQQLGNQHHHDKRQIARADTHIHDVLGNEGHDQAEQAAHEHRQQKLDDIALVGPKVT